MTNKTAGLDSRRTGVVSQKREASQEAPGKNPGRCIGSLLRRGGGSDKRCRGGFSLVHLHLVAEITPGIEAALEGPNMGDALLF